MLRIKKPPAGATNTNGRRIRIKGRGTAWQGKKMHGGKTVGLLGKCT